MSTVRDLRRMLSALAHLPPDTPVNVATVTAGPASVKTFRLVSLEVDARAGHPDELRILAAPFDVPE